MKHLLLMIIEFIQMLIIDINVIVSCGKQVFSIGSLAFVCDKDYSVKAGWKFL